MNKVRQLYCQPVGPETPPNMTSGLTSEQRQQFFTVAARRAAERVLSDTSGKLVASPAVVPLVKAASHYMRHRCPEGFCIECDDPRDNSGF